MDIHVPSERPALILPGDPQSVRNPSGFIFIDGVQVADTLQCVHCQAHFVVVKGSGRTRGHCYLCQGPTCSPQCANCYPAQKQLEDEERRAAKLAL